MNKNESPHRPLSDDVLYSIIKQSQFNQYPEQEHTDFIAAYAQFNQLNPEQIGVANGSDEWIQKCMMTLGTGDIMTLNPDFVMYTTYACQLGRKVHYIDCDATFQFDIDLIIAEIKLKKPDLFILSQPNNPTGQLMSDAFIQALSDAMKAINGYLILDEAYIEFSRSYTVPQGAHIIQMRTLSKAYGFAGLRIGVVIADSNVLARLNSVAHPYPVNALSLQIATAFIKDTKAIQAFIATQLQLTTRLKSILYKQRDIIEVMDSETNFVLTYGENAVSLGTFIQKHGFQIRTYPDIPILKDTVRYSITTEEQLNQFEQLIHEWRVQNDFN